MHKMHFFMQMNSLLKAENFQIRSIFTSLANEQPLKKQRNFEIRSNFLIFNRWTPQKNQENFQMLCYFPPF